MSLLPPPKETSCLFLNMIFFSVGERTFRLKSKSKEGDGMEPCSLGIRMAMFCAIGASAPSTPLEAPVASLSIFNDPGGYKAA